MRMLILIYLFVQSTLTFATVVISDLDDTVKITHVQNKAQALKNALFSTKVFEPMPELLRAMDGYSSGVYILSASPKIFNRQIKKLLRVNEIPYRGLYTRNLKQLRDKVAYKKNTIRNLINSEDEVVLIGDNVEADADIYLDIKKEFPEKDFQIYIHLIKNLKIQPGAIGYFTAFDIAVHEYLKKRMNFYEVMDVANKILSQKTLASVITCFSYCPTQYDEFTYSAPVELMPAAKLVQTKVIKYCQQRNQ